MFFIFQMIKKMILIIYDKENDINNINRKKNEIIKKLFEYNNKLKEIIILKDNQINTLIQELNNTQHFYEEKRNKE